jgi:hypothetical protein
MPLHCEAKNGERQRAHAKHKGLERLTGCLWPLNSLVLARLMPNPQQFQPVCIPEYFYE